MSSMNYAKYSKKRKEFVFKAVFENSFDTIIEFLTVMNELGIKAEHECFDAGHVANLDPLIDMGLLKEPMQISCVMGVTGGIRPTAKNLAFMSEQIPGGPDGPNNWGVIGISRDQWMLVGAALSLGGNVRVGLEDNFYLPNGEMAKSNGELVAKAREMVENAGRRVATVEEAREMMGTPKRRRGVSAARCWRTRSSGGGVRVSALEGVKVLDLTRLLPGGFCTLLLADFGAEVLKVEDTGMGDYVRWAPPYHEGAEDSAKSSLFLALNRNKRSIRINLKEERGREVLLRLVKEYDVVIESFRPGVLDRLGVGYERLREENPRVIYCAITGYGQDGPYRDRSGHDMNYLGLIGLLGLTGEQDGPPIQSAGQIADLGGGALMAAFGVLAALHERERSGEGQLVDVSMADGALAWLAMVAGPLLRRRRRCRSAASSTWRAGSSATGPYACKDGWVTLGALEPKFFQALVPRRRPRGPDREAVRAAGLRGARRDRARLPRAHARGVARVRLAARLLPRAGARPRRGARLGARARARDGRGARPAGHRWREAARRAGEDVAHARRPARARARRWASTRTRCWRPPATRRGGLRAGADGRSGGRRPGERSRASTTAARRRHAERTTAC